MDLSSPSSVANLAEACTGKFNELLSLKDSDLHITLENRAADFQLWVDGVGAVAKPGASLDSRFRDRPDDLVLVKGILVMLIDFLSELSTQDSSTDTALLNVDSALSNLAIIGVAIRRTGKASRSRRADQSFNLDHYEDLRRHLECMLLLRPSEDVLECQGFNASTAIRSENLEVVGSKLQEMVSCQLGQLDSSNLTEVQRRLIDTNLRRRHRFVLAQKRAQHNKAAREAARQAARQTTRRVAFQEVTVLPESEPRSQDTSSNPEIEKAQKKTQRLPGETPKEPTIAVESTASTAEGTMQYNPKAKYVPTVAQSQISFIANEMDFPRLSPSLLDRQIIECPCCCQPLPYDEVRKPTNWRQHLIEDICPYSCVAEKCPTPQLLFATRKAWDMHVENDHPCQWKCVVCGQDAANFSTVSDVTSHIQSFHQSELSSQTLSDLIEWSRVQHMGIRSCPLCSSHGPEDSPELIDHVVRHAYEFALRSLPWPHLPIEDLNKPVGAYAPPKDPEEAARLWHWLEEAFCDDTQQTIMLSSFDRADHEVSITKRSLQEDYFDSNAYFDQISAAGSQLVAGDEANEVPNYPYWNLSVARAEIRLIVLTADEDPLSPIQCHLEQVSLGVAKEYVALSYCWGDHSDGTREIMVSGTRRRVSKTLEHALQELRRRKQYRVWVDQICINQHNSEERAQQVERMGDIYRYASVTMAWLGHFAASDTALFGGACALIEALSASLASQDGTLRNQSNSTTARPISGSSYPLESLMHWTGLTSMFQRDYWSRAWIIQEVAVSKQVEFFWNGQSVSISDLQNAVTGCKALASTSSEANALTSLPLFEHVERLIRFRNFRESPIRLIEALILSRRAKSSNPRDKLYALKHLAIDGPDSVPFPDYEAPLEDLNRKTADRLLQHYKNADFIMLPCHFWETWVPQWHDPATWHEERINKYLTGRSNFVTERSDREHGSSTIVHKWRATRDSAAHWSTTPGGRHLQVRCKRLGRVEKCSATDAEASTAEVIVLSDLSRTRYGPRKVERLISLCWLLYDLIPNNNYPKPKNIKIGHIHRLLTESVRESVQTEAPEFYKWLFCKQNLDFKIDGIPLANWLCAASDKTHVNTMKKVMRCYSSVQMEMRLFMTDQDHLGWATSSCQPGDELFLIQGCSVPVVLRKKENRELYQLIGDSIVHGLMDGQGIADPPFESWPLLTLA